MNGVFISIFKFNLDVMSFELKDKFSKVSIKLDIRAELEYNLRLRPNSIVLSKLCISLKKFIEYIQFNNLDTNNLN